METATYPSSSFDDPPSRGRVYGLVQGDHLGAGAPSCPVPQCTPTASCSRMQSSPTPSTFAPSSECPSRCSPSPPSSLSPLRGHKSYSPDGEQQRLSEACHYSVFQESPGDNQESHFSRSQASLPIATSVSPTPSRVDFSCKPLQNHQTATYGACHSGAQSPQYSHVWNSPVQPPPVASPGVHSAHYLPHSSGQGSQAWGRPEDRGPPITAAPYWDSSSCPDGWTQGEEAVRTAVSHSMEHHHGVTEGPSTLSPGMSPANGGGMNPESVTALPQGVNGQQAPLDMRAGDYGAYSAESRWICGSSPMQAAPPTLPPLHQRTLDTVPVYSQGLTGPPPEQHAYPERNAAPAASPSYPSREYYACPSTSAFAGPSDPPPTTTLSHLHAQGEVATRSHPYGNVATTSSSQPRRISSARPRPRGSGGGSRQQRSDDLTSKPPRKVSQQPRPPRPAKPRNPNCQVSRPVRGLPLHQRKLYRHFARQTPRVQGLTFDHNQIRWYVVVSVNEP